MPLIATGIDAGQEIHFKSKSQSSSKDAASVLHSRGCEEELLMSRVRLRYEETPLFTTVGSVTSSYSFDVGGTTMRHLRRIERRIFSPPGRHPLPVPGIFNHQHFTRAGTGLRRSPYRQHQLRAVASAPHGRLGPGSALADGGFQGWESAQGPPFSLR